MKLMRSLPRWTTSVNNAKLFDNAPPEIHQGNIYVCVCMYVCVSVCVYMCVCVCMCVCIHIYIHTLYLSIYLSIYLYLNTDLT